MTEAQQLKEKIISKIDSLDEFYKGIDGFVYYWPTDYQHGCFDAMALRIIADELDRRNKDWSEQVGRISI